MENHGNSSENRYSEDSDHKTVADLKPDLQGPVVLFLLNYSQVILTERINGAIVSKVLYHALLHRSNFILKYCFVAEFRLYLVIFQANSAFGLFTLVLYNGAQLLNTFAQRV